MKDMQRFLEHAPQIEPMSQAKAEEFYSLGSSLYESGSTTEAEKVFRVLCMRKPLVFHHWFGLAASLQEEKRYEEALQAWAMAAALHPKDPASHFHAAECSYSLGKRQEAVDALKAALARATDDPLLQERISLLQERWNPWQE